MDENMNNKKILVVDDDDLVRMITVRMLKGNYNIITAASGQEAIDLYEKERPDLILSDLMMPGMSGFEMMEKLREMHNFVIPVMFMTAYSSDDAEKKGLEVGAVDYIRKPFKAEVLLHRINNIMVNLDRIRGLQRQAEIEPMTGLLNKITTAREIGIVASRGRGIFMMLDLDSFKLVNDLYGHEKGDRFLIWFADLLRNITRSSDIVGRVGGDEFVVFCQNVRDEKMVAERTKFMNRKILSYAKELLGEDMNIPLGVSVGAAICPDEGTEYSTLFKKADQALYLIKQSGKHDYAFYKLASDIEQNEKKVDGMDEIHFLLKERDVKRGALLLELEQFKLIYRYMMRFQNNYAWDVHLIVFNIEKEGAAEEEIKRAADHFMEVAGSCLRGSDALTRFGVSNVLAIFLKTTDIDCQVPVDRIREKWEQDTEAAGFTFSWNKEFMTS